jgi:hypothetical protein
VVTILAEASNANNANAENSTVDVLDRIFELDARIRYVALYRAGALTSRQRADLRGASASESDRYEELFVNPTLLKLAQQRGNLDCGGAGFVVVGYGNFYQLVIALDDGHVSVCFELSGQPLTRVKAIREACSFPGRT